MTKVRIVGRHGVPNTIFKYCFMLASTVISSLSLTII